MYAPGTVMTLTECRCENRRRTFPEGAMEPRFLVSSITGPTKILTVSPRFANSTHQSTSVPFVLCVSHSNLHFVVYIYQRLYIK